MRRRPSNTDDVIDSRDVIEAISEIEEELELEGDEGLDAEDREDLRAELATLKALEAQGTGSPDWTYGETLIRDSYFEEYAEQLADDIGAIDSDASWPLSFIDWEAAADALKQDYFSVEFDGVEYWIRA